MENLRSTLKICWNLRVPALGPVLAAVLVTAGCSSIGGDAASIIDVAKQAWRGGGDVSLKEAAAVPYASIGVRVGNSAQVMLILASDVGGQQLWTSSARIAIATKNGRIVRTAGFGHDLAGYQLREQVQNKEGVTTLTWYADFPELHLYAVPVACTARSVGEETITILGKEIRTQRVNESCTARSDQLDWSFENLYWFDQSRGFTWRSRQHVNPDLDAIEIETLRPPA